MTDVPWQQASDRADELEQSTGHNMSVRGLSEAVDPMSGRGAIAQAIAGARPPSPIPVRRKDPAVKIDIQNRQLDPYAQTYNKPVEENFADGKVKGKSRPGRVKRSGASCNGSVTDLRARAKRASGEKAKMYHWCANMKSGKK
jgi:hypothetical protein